MLDENEPKLELEEEKVEETQEQEEVVQDEAQVEAPEQVEDVKQKAKSTGHLSQEEYLAKHGSLKGYKTEDEFVRTGDMIEQMYSLKKKLHERDSEISAILNYQKATIEEHKVKMRQELEAKLQQAREYGNIEAIEALTAQKTTMLHNEQQEQLKAQLDTKQAVVSAFLDRNKHWYNPEHPEVVARCNQIDQEISAYHNNIGKPLSYEALAQAVEDQMKREYPDLVNTGVSQPRPVLSNTSSQVSKTVATRADSEDKIFNSLPADYKHMYNANKRMFAKQDMDYTVKEFIAQLKKDGDI